jgi:FtsH-binding integral membrane protein
MSENTYAIHDDQLAINAPADARATFLQKTYSLVFAGVLTFALTLFLSGPDMPLHSLAMSIGLNWITTLVIFFGGMMAVRMLARTVMGLPLFFAFTFGFGLIAAPLVSLIQTTDGGAVIIGQASLMTAFLFLGLTAYVFKSGRDFSFLYGFLWLAFFGMMGVAVASWLLGYSVGVWYSYLGAGLMCAHILYDTSNVMRRYSTDSHVSAALELFTDVVLLFWYLLQIAWSLNRD